ncbi:MAG: hypothetical protein IJY23_04125 [Clostridia bacterium]|nr:hypothetical protein [Clostridia bacterium]
MKLLKNFYDNYISLNLKKFPNINVDIEINKLLFFVTVGLMIACFIINYYEMNVALLIKKLMRHGAFSEEQGRTLGELGLGDNKAVKSILSKNSGITKKIIFSTGKKIQTYEEYVLLEKERKAAKKLPGEERKKAIDTLNKSLSLDFSSVRFYIPESSKGLAEHYYKTKNGSLLKTVLYCVLMLVFYVLVALLMPTLLNFIDGILV